MGSAWTLDVELHAPLPRSRSQLGSALALEGEQLIAGAPAFDVPGSAHLFLRDTSGWSASTPLIPSARPTSVDFGHAVDVHGDIAVVGAPHGTDRPGSIHVFRQRARMWSEVQELTPSTSSAPDLAGAALSLGDVLLIGAPADAVNGVGSGAAYVAVLLGAPCDAAEQCASGFCSHGRCCDRACSDCGRCDIAGYEGTCSPVPGGSEGAASCGLYMCDGENVTCPAGCVADADCAPTAHCDTSGHCAPGVDRGEPCASDRDCLDGVCQDGVCCEAACNGACERCDLEGSQGSCRTLDCGPYACGDGSCLTGCVSTLDCGAGFNCSADGRCVSPGEANAGCSCQLPASAAPFGGLGIVIVGLSLLAFTRRRAGWRRPCTLAVLVACTPTRSTSHDNGHGLDRSATDDPPWHPGGTRRARSDRDKGRAPTDDPSFWSERPRLVAPEVTAGANFAAAVALEAKTALVAAGESGAYVLEREGPIWTAQQLLSPSDTEHGGGFAWTIALSGNTALLGAPEHGELDDFEGAVYLFERGPLGFIEEERLTTPAIDSADDEFGVSVSIDGDTVVVGSPGEDHSDCNDAGAVYVFERQGMGWTGPQRLAASLPSSEARFGSAVGVDGDTLAVGAPHALFPVSDPGAVHVFERSTSGWIERQTLSPTLGPGLNFGIAVALEGDMLIAGAGYDDVDGLFGAGAVYFYARTGSEFVEAQRLTADAPQSFGKFGHSLGLDRNRSVVTGIEDQHAIAYVFAWRLGTWSLEQKIAVTPPPLGKSDVSIPSVAIDEGTTFVGEPWTAVSGEHEAGVVRHYVLVGATCSTATECPGGFCTDGVCCDAACDGSCDGCAQPGFRGRCTVVESGALCPLLVRWYERPMFRQLLERRQLRERRSLYRPRCMRGARPRGRSLRRCPRL
jgi:hypothetical protein